MADVTQQADAAAIAEAKRLLRHAVRIRRSARSTAQREQDDEQRAGRLIERLRLRPPRCLAAYLSTGTEPDSLRLVSWAAAREITVLLPVLTNGAGSWLDEPAWAAYEGPDRLREGRSQILEPTGPMVSGDTLRAADVMVIPGLAADPEGHRLGRGGGWYDRARVSCLALETWLLLNDDEVLEVVPTDVWDLPVHRIVTPGRVVDVAGDRAS